MKAYLLGIVAVAFLVSMLNTLGRDRAGKGTRKLVGGILLTLAVFRPFGTLELTVPDADAIRFHAESAVSAGLEQAEEERLRRITGGYDAYIWNKAAELGLDAEVQTTVGEDGMAVSVSIRAAASPTERQELTGTLIRELGIEKEAVVWIDPYQSSESMP